MIPSIADSRPLEERLARRTARMGANAIREILKVASQPGMVSLAGGLPAPESFPLEIIRTLADDVLAEQGAAALQYNATEGYGPLREALVPFLAARGVETGIDGITVFSGSQGVLDTMAKVLISTGDVIAIESPSYLGAISAFNAYEPNYVSVATDEDGVIPEDLARLLDEHPVKLLYLVPTFQNPTGRTLSLARRKAVAELLRAHDVLLLEDDPYSSLRYEGEALPPIHAFAPEHVVYTSTFSKVLAPGLRLGFSVAPTDLARWLVIAKQGVDLHTNTYGQAIAAAYLAEGHLAAHLPHILDLYRPRRDALLGAMDTYAPPGWRWSRPAGGMFLWAEGPAELDVLGLYERCVAGGIAFVPGQFFFANGGGETTMRLNFTSAEAPVLERAVSEIMRTAAAMSDGVSAAVPVPA
jgi:2-aminoadipate transaminase